jgi:hypothetical protein
MWESRGLGEISKARWTPVCGVHGAVISTAGSVSAPVWAAIRSRSTGQDAPGTTIALPVER